MINVVVLSLEIVNKNHDNIFFYHNNVRFASREDATQRDIVGPCYIHLYIPAHALLDCAENVAHPTCVLYPMLLPCPEPSHVATQGHIVVGVKVVSFG